MACYEKYERNLFGKNCFSCHMFLLLLVIAETRMVLSFIYGGIAANFPLRCDGRDVDDYLFLFSTEPIEMETFI